MWSAHDDILRWPSILDKGLPTEVLGVVVLKCEPFATFQRLQRFALMLQFDNEDPTIAFALDHRMERLLYSS
jgi:hypothetical protein